MMERLRKMILDKYPDFFKDIDPNIKLFAREIRKELRNEGHVVLGITGYPGVGKSSAAALIGCLIDENYKFDMNICFIPTSKEISEKYMGFPMYSFFHVDEASRGLHKHKWYDKVQQTINTLYDVNREGHFLCTCLIMPRFQNFTENFRNFMITYWINIPTKGLTLFYKKDEDKDVKDPWHMDENYKKKQKKWKNKRVFERTVGDIIGAEQITDCYWFYSKIPAIPTEIWAEYQKLKKESRVEPEVKELSSESYHERITRERKERWNTIIEMREKGFTLEKIGVILGISHDTVRKNLKDIKEFQKLPKKEVKV